MSVTICFGHHISASFSSRFGEPKTGKTQGANGIPHLCPNLWCSTSLPVRTRAIPLVRPAGLAVEAARRSTRVWDRSLEHVRVRGGHDIGHHGARAAARDEDLARVALVRRERVVDHAGDRVAVAAAVVRQRRVRRHVPAGPGVRGFGVYDDEALLVGELCVRRPGIVPLRGAGAVVDGDDDGRRVGELGGHVDVHLCVGRVGPEVGDLLQGFLSAPKGLGRRCELVEDGTCGDGGR
jgi:hypothetical protein